MSAKTGQNLGILVLLISAIALHTQFVNEVTIENDLTISCPADTIYLGGNGDVTVNNMAGCNGWTSKPKLEISGSVNLVWALYQGRSNFQEITLGDSVTFTGRVFQGTMISSFIFPTAMDYIPEGTFDGC